MKPSLKIDKRRGGKKGITCNFLDLGLYVVIFRLLRCSSPGRYITEGKKREREGGGGEESKLQLAEVFGLNSENDPFNSDGL